MKVANCIRCKVWVIDSLILEEGEKEALRLLMRRAIVNCLVFDVICEKCRTKLGLDVSKTLLEIYKTNPS